LVRFCRSLAAPRSDHPGQARHQVFGRGRIDIALRAGGFFQHRAHHVAGFQQQIQHLGVQRHTMIAHQPDQVFGQMRPAFDHAKPQHAGIALERVHPAKQGSDMGRLFRRRRVFERDQRGFHGIHRLRAVIGEQRPEFIHLVGHRTTFRVG
jgi:hypothetical protein